MGSQKIGFSGQLFSLVQIPLQQLNFGQKMPEERILGINTHCLLQSGKGLVQFGCSNLLFCFFCQADDNLRAG